MAVTKSEIKDWCEIGLKQKATHLIVAVDTFDWDDFPIYVQLHENVKSLVDKYSKQKSMLKVMEVYNLSKPLEPQLDKERNFEL